MKKTPFPEGRKIGNDIDKLKTLFQIDNTTELLKGVVLTIHNDLLVTLTHNVSRC
ncbi:hypothetical protein [Rahnella bruchi]|uniref:hypothetical protein n=1 Tax=Rahnella bruchi TaxID=1510573 RepID=UPI001FC9EB0E|nr:hypothetical protein [Rahnella bruchi]